MSIRKTNTIRITILIIAGILVSYIQQMGPSPLLILLRDEFHLHDREALLNLCVSVIFPFLIIGSFLGSYAERKIGVKHLYTLALAFLSVGLVGNFWASGVVFFLICRCIFGIGFGLCIPFIGLAIMKWYDTKQREYMTTLNALFPFIATLITYCLMLPLTSMFGGSWRFTLGIWGVLTIIILLAWHLTVHSIDNNSAESEYEAGAPEQGLYRSVFRRKPIRYLTYIFMCDFFCYSYIATILPTWLFEMGGLSEEAAGIMAAIAFPLFGLAGCCAGGLFSSKTGLLNPPVKAGQLLKLLGLSAAAVSTNLWITISGIILFSFGNGVWMPSMYSIPTKLKGMNSARVGAAFALMSSCGFFCGFFSPVIGGWLTERISSGSSSIGVQSHVFGLRWCTFIFGLVNLAAFVFSMLIEEAGGSNTNKNLMADKPQTYEE